MESVEKKSRKTSRVWNHFKEIDPKESAQCLHCLGTFSIKNGCVGNLNRHMKKKHPAVWGLSYGFEQDSLSSLDKSNSDDDETLDKYEKANVHNDKYEKVYVLSRENNVENNSGEEYEYLEEITPPKKKKQKYSPQKINHRYKRNSNYREPQRREYREHERSYIKEEDRSDIFGKLVTLKMRSLDSNQRLIAEKLINDTLHEAELGNLNKYCCISAVQMIHANEEPATNDAKNATVTTNTDTT